MTRQTTTFLKVSSGAFLWLLAVPVSALNTGQTGLIEAASNAGLTTTGVSVEQYVGIVINAA
ncbi:MAG: hypothetical protein AAB855_00600, partial [Patescibacteria group bacterium]